MLDSPFISKAFEHEGCELWSLVRPYDVWCSISTKYVQEGICQAMGSGVFAHSNNFGPVGTAVNNDEKLLSSEGAEVNGDFLKRSCWTMFWYHGFGGCDGSESWHCLQAKITSMSWSIPGQ